MDPKLDKIDKMNERVTELTIIMNRVEELIDKLSEISTNLTILVNTHSNKIENLTSIQAQDRLNLQSTIDKLEKRTEDLKNSIEKDYVRKERFDPVQKILYACVGLILSGFVGAVLNLVMK